MKFYTPQEIAEKLKVSKLTVYDLIKKGELEAVKIGKIYRISQEALDNFLKKSTATNQIKTRGRKPSLELPI